MKKINNNGYMLIEIILASVLTFIIVYFLLDITLSLKNKNDNSYEEVVYNNDRAIMSKVITEDINNYQIKGINFCNEGTACIDFMFEKYQNTFTKRLLITNTDHYVFHYGQIDDNNDYIIDIDNGEYYYLEKEFHKHLTVNAINVKNECYGNTEKSFPTDLSSCVIVPSSNKDLTHNGLLTINIPVTSSVMNGDFGLNILVPYLVMDDNNGFIYSPPKELVIGDIVSLSGSVTTSLSIKIPTADTPISLTNVNNTYITSTGVVQGLTIALGSTYSTYYRNNLLNSSITWQYLDQTEDGRVRVIYNGTMRASPNISECHGICDKDGAFGGRDVCDPYYGSMRNNCFLMLSSMSGYVYGKDVLENIADLYEKNNFVSEAHNITLEDIEQIVHWQRSDPSLFSNDNGSWYDTFEEYNPLSNEDNLPYINILFPNYSYWIANNYIKNDNNYPSFGMYYFNAYPKKITGVNFCYNNSGTYICGREIISPRIILTLKSNIKLIWDSTNSYWTLSLEED